jgi:PAS domain S-box-containing protein
MTKHKDENLEAGKALRQRAEALAGGMTPESLGNLEVQSPGEWRRTLYELRVHQIELEMQNDELRQSQEDLDRARACYFDLYDLAPVGYMTVSHGNRVIEANLTAISMLGLSRVALLNQPFTHFIHRDDQDLYYLHRKQFYETGTARAGELRLVKADGTVFWAYLAATHIQEDPACPEHQVDDAKPRARLVMSDITWRKQAEEKTAKLESELHQAQELKALGVLAGGVAHVINNLLTTILGNANLGTLAVGADGKVASYFSAIETATQRAANLTAQLLAYAGKGKYWVTEVDLDVVVKEVLQRIAPTLPGRVTLRCEGADRLPFVKGDATQIAQILMGLLSNAAESFGDGRGGQITIRTRAEAMDVLAVESACWCKVIEPGRYATLEVIDTGAGMTAEVLARAFEPFFSTKFTGRGLGLAAVMGILCNHGGGLSAHSEVGRGSSFKIYLPALQEARAPQAAPDLPSWRGAGKLLVADQDQEIRSTVRRMAERLGFTVVEARGGQEALEIFRLRHGDLALVLLDLTMPRMGAAEAFAEMRKIDRKVPVVLSQGYDMAEEPALPEGLAGMIKKPYRMAEFQGLLQRTLA